MKINNRSIFSILAAALLLMAAVLLISSDSERTNIGDDSDEGTYYTDNKKDKKTVCEATLEDDFAENGILVVLIKETSFKTYTPEDFAEIGCSKVTELTIWLTYIELAESGKENVLLAIKKLEERDDVLYAEPDYILHLC